LKLDPNHKPRLAEELEHSRPLDVHKCNLSNIGLARIIEASRE